MSAPSGTVTFLFTDIEGSTRLWEERPEEMRVALTWHDSLLRQTISVHRGQVFKTMGDAFYAAFSDPSDAVAAALEAQRRLNERERNARQESEAMPGVSPVVLKVRMALNTGLVEARDNDYFGPPLNRVARLLGVGYGGQVLLTQATYDLASDALSAGIDFEDLGEHRLRDLSRPERVFQLRHPELPAAFPPLKSLNALPNNLPQAVTSFIGRGKEIAAVKALLGRTRLLTLVGVGGSGKTRLALQVAADLLEEERDGVWLVELAPLSDPALVPQTVATALNVREQPGQSLMESLVEALRAKRMLLLLDNCEHLLDACARLADTLIRACPELRLLASSREMLGIAGETTYRIPSLSLPDPRLFEAGNASMDSLADYESVRLFAERAAAVAPAFAITEQNAPTVAQVCYRLDGIPLALELAAARVRALPVEQIATRLDDRFRLLTGGSRTALPRQQTLRALIDWSYDLLNAQERVLLRRLSVFCGGWNLEAAEAICAEAPLLESWEVLDLSTSLVDKSLVLYDEETGRYRMLETVRQYSLERLLESGETDTFRERHRDCYLALVERSEPEMMGGDQTVWLDRLERDLDNIRLAFEWSIGTQKSHPEAALRLAGAFCRFWYIRGYLSEGQGLLTRILPSSIAEDVWVAERAKALNAAGMLWATTGDYEKARDYYAQSLALRRRLGDKRLVAGSLNNLGYIAHEQGDYTAAQSHLEESLAIYRELGETWFVATVLNNLGRIPNDLGEYAAARSLYEESLSLRRAIHDTHGIAMSLTNLGIIALEQGAWAEAESLLRESLTLRQELGDRYGVGISLKNLGEVALQRGDHEGAHHYLREALNALQEAGNKPTWVQTIGDLALLATEEGQAERALVLFGAEEALRERLGVPILPHQRARYTHYVARARHAIGAERSERAWATGRAMTEGEISSFARLEGAGILPR